MRDEPRYWLHQTAYEKMSGKQDCGAIMKFGEFAMGRIPHDVEERSKKLDSVWIKGCWGRRAEAPGEHVLSTGKK